MRRYLNSLALGLGDRSHFAALDGPGEVCHGDDEERVTAEELLIWVSLHF